MNYSFIIVLVIIKDVTLSKILSYTLLRSFGTYDFFLTIGGSIKQVELDMTNQYLCVYDYKHLDNDTFNSNVTLPIYNENINFSLSYTTIEVGHEVVVNVFPVFTFQNTSLMKFDSFPLAHHYFNTSHSIIHSLYNKKYIENRSFGLYFNLLSGYLFFGGIPKEFIDEFHYSHQFKVMSKDQLSWTIDIKKVQFNGTTIKINNNVMLQSNIKYIKAPESFLYQLADTVFKDYIKTNACIFHKETLTKYFQCSCEEIINFPNFKFTLGDIEIEFKSNEMFFNNDFVCPFMIESSSIYQNQWVFGLTFLQRYVSYFDIDNDMITLYSKTEFKIVSNDKLKYFIGLNIFINLISFIILLYMKFKL